MSLSNFEGQICRTWLKGLGIGAEDVSRSHPGFQIGYLGVCFENVPGKISGGPFCSTYFN